MLCLALDSLDALRAVRHRLERWLERERVPEPLAACLVIAAHEALANALLHSGTPQPVELTARHVDGCVTIEVVDRGVWALPSDGRPGLGLLMMRRALPAAMIDTGAGGTTVTLVQPLE